METTHTNHLSTQTALSTLAPVQDRQVRQAKPSSAFGHIKSRYWNRAATKAIHTAMRNHFKQHASIQLKCSLQAM